MNTAYKDKLLVDNLLDRLKPIKEQETHIEFLSLEELQKLASTDCPEWPELKKAALFSGLTGLRFSDISQLTWVHIRKTKPNEYKILFKQEKTEGVEYLDISAEAFDLLGPVSAPNQLVFDNLVYSTRVSNVLKKWTERVEIHRRIKFHCFRHTFATLQIAAGTDLYTLSKLMGHKSTKTTQRYAKLVDKLKREAVDRITLTLYRLLLKQCSLWG